MAVSQSDIAAGIARLGLTGLPVCLHSSLRSFGQVIGGADAVVDAFLAAGCTVVVPTHNYINELAPPPGVWIERNGLDPDDPPADPFQPPPRHDPTRNEMSTGAMGAIPAAVLARSNRIRGQHPLDSFSGIGPEAEAIISSQAPDDPYKPLIEIGTRGGSVLLIGVGLDRMTLLHAAERAAGRELFRRWAMGRDGERFVTITGGCSEGFGHLEEAVGSLADEIFVGSSRWRRFPIDGTIAAAAAKIQQDPNITHCGDPLCLECRDAVLGGPRIPSSAR